MTSSQKTYPEAPDWHLFLHRVQFPQPELQRECMDAFLAEKRVLITGAGGCIGSALAKRIAQSDVGELILLDSSEGALYDIQQAIAEQKGASPYTPVLASVCNPIAITDVFEQYRPEIVFHAAALKHVPLMEKNPFAAVANNVFGTQLLVETAVSYRCEQLLMVSTDKAVAPSSIMGASKRIAELILLTPRPEPVCMKAIRLGNVLGSSGSVVPLFQRQITHGGPVTVSHPDVRRYFMTLAETVATLLSALSPDSPAGVSAPELGEPIRILDLAKFMIGQQRVPIAFTELRPGDKMEESLISSSESYQNTSNGSLRPINSPHLSYNELSSLLNNLQEAIRQRDLPSLLQAVQRMVPEYHPSLPLRMNSDAMVNA